MTERLTKEEVEDRLRSKSEEISSRFESIESNIPGSKSPMIRLLKQKRKVRMSLVLGAGLLLGMFLVRSRRKNSGNGHSGNVESLSRQIAQQISEGLAHGEDPSEAVRRSLSENPPLMNFENSSDGILNSAVRQLARTGAGILATELGHYLKARLTGSDQSSSGEES